MRKSCDDCPKFITLVSGWKCCMGSSCEMDVRADERQKCEEEFKQALKRYWLKGTVAYRVIDDVLAEYEMQLKGDQT